MAYIKEHEISRPRAWLARLLETVKRDTYTPFFAVQSFASTWIGDTRIVTEKLLITVEQIDAIEDELKPGDIILERRGRKTVYIVQRGIALERRLELGIETSDSVEVIEGLSPEDSLIIEGFETLRNRSRVKVIE